MLDIGRCTECHGSVYCNDMGEAVHSCSYTKGKTTLTIRVTDNSENITVEVSRPKIFSRYDIIKGNT